jgi:hypothetical protein
MRSSLRGWLPDLVLSGRNSDDYKSSISAILIGKHHLQMLPPDILLLLLDLQSSGLGGGLKIRHKP